MNEYDELLGGKKLPWSHSQQDFVTAVLALGGHLPNEDDLDALGERMLKMVDLDPSPFPDFQSMRLALQHGCDVATHEAMLNDELRQFTGALTALQQAGIGFAENDAGEPADEDISLQQVQEVINLNSKLAFQATGGPARRFVKMPYPDAKLCWNATLNDFVNLVVGSELYRVFRLETEENILELIAERYRSAFDVDYAGYSDFNALRLAYPETVNFLKQDSKTWRLPKALRILCDAGPITTLKRFPAFVVQTKYHTIVAEEVGKHCPDADVNLLTHLFDLLFLPDELIDEVLERREE